MIEVFDYLADYINAINGVLLAIIGVLSTLKQVRKKVMDFLGLDDDDDDPDDKRG